MPACLRRACHIRKRDKDPGKMLTPSSYLGLCLEQLASFKPTQNLSSLSSLLLHDFSISFKERFYKYGLLSSPKYYRHRSAPSFPKHARQQRARRPCLYHQRFPTSDTDAILFILVDKNRLMQIKCFEKRIIVEDMDSYVDCYSWVMSYSQTDTSACPSPRICDLLRRGRFFR